MLKKRSEDRWQSISKYGGIDPFEKISKYGCFDFALWIGPSPVG
jgi:hypothetical protein